MKNTENASLKKGGWICGAIFSAAGNQELQKECDKIGRCEVGEVLSRVFVAYSIGCK